MLLDHMAHAWIPGLICCLIGILILRKPVGLPWAVLISVIRFTIPTVYFMYFFDYSWSTLDDIHYFEKSSELIGMGENFFDIILNYQIWADVKDSIGSQHAFYVIWNILAQEIFGEYYYSPVFLNNLVSLLSVPALMSLSQLSGFNTRYSKYMGIFFALHWDVIAWCSFLNIKDSIVLLLTILSLYCLNLLFIKFTFRTLLGLLCCFLLFSIVRFYVPILLLIATGLIAVTSSRGKWKWPVIILASVLVWHLLPADIFEYIRPMIFYNHVVYGTVRYWLTPQPWSIRPAYSFLVIPAAMHWLLFLPAIYGGIRLWMTTRTSRLMLLYIFVLTGLYVVIPESQGVRHRFQISFIFLWMQYHAFVTLLCTPKFSLPTTNQEVSVNKNVVA